MYSDLFDSKTRQLNERGLAACQELGVDPETLHPKFLTTFMNQFEGDEAMARLNSKYYKYRRVKNLLRITKWLEGKGSSKVHNNSQTIQP